MKIKRTQKSSPKRMFVTVFTTTIIASFVIFAVIYQFRPQTPTEDLSNFFHKIPGLKMTNTASSSAGLSKNGSTQNPSKEDLKQYSKELDSLNIDNFDASIGENDR